MVVVPAVLFQPLSKLSIDISLRIVLRSANVCENHKTTEILAQLAAPNVDFVLSLALVGK